MGDERDDNDGAADKHGWRGRLAEKQPDPNRRENGLEQEEHADIRRRQEARTVGDAEPCDEVLIDAGLVVVAVVLAVVLKV